MVGISLPFHVGLSPTLGIRGLLASRNISKGEIIERCPAIIYTKNMHLDQTVFAKYVFDWDDAREALALGYGSLMNHARPANVIFDFDSSGPYIVFTALRSIIPGEELFIDYDSETGEPVDQGYFSFDKELQS